MGSLSDFLFFFDGDILRDILCISSLGIFHWIFFCLDSLWDMQEKQLGIFFKGYEKWVYCLAVFLFMGVPPVIIHFERWDFP